MLSVRGTITVRICATASEDVINVEEDAVSFPKSCKGANSHNSL
jgi:hypothetical protein